MSKTMLGERMQAVREYVSKRATKWSLPLPNVPTKERPTGEKVVVLNKDNKEYDVQHRNVHDTRPDEVNDPLASKLLAAVVQVLDSRQEVKGELERVKAELAYAQKRLEEENLEKQRISSQIDLQRKEIENLQKQLSDQSLTLDQLHEDYRLARELHQQQVRELQEELNSANRRYDALKEEMEKMVLAKERKIIELESERKDQDAQYKKLMESHNNLKRDNQLLVEHISGFAEKSLVSLSSQYAAQELPPAPLTKPTLDSKESAETEDVTETSGNTGS